MKILDLVLMYKWYDLIDKGRKREEYRTIKEYWQKRLEGTHYTHVRFRRGYTSTTMLWKIDIISIGVGFPSWGAPSEACYIISFHERCDE